MPGTIPSGVLTDKIAAPDSSVTHDRILRAAAADDGYISVTAGPTQMVEQFAELLADNPKVQGQFDRLVAYMSKLRHVGIPMADLEFYDGERVKLVAEFHKNPDIETTLSVRLTVDEANALSNQIDDAVGRVVGERNYPFGLDDEFDADRDPARSVMDR